MDDGSERAVLAVNRLIEMGRDCESALAAAADVAESLEVRDRYRRRAAAWAQFCAALQTAVVTLGGAPPGNRDIAGTLRRAWIKIKSGVGDAEAIAAECSRREATAMQCCIQAVDRGLPPELRLIVEEFTRMFPVEQEHELHRGASVSDPEERSRRT